MVKISQKKEFDLTISMDGQPPTLGVRKHKFCLFSDTEPVCDKWHIELVKVIGAEEKYLRSKELMIHSFDMRLCPGGQRTAKCLFNQRFALPKEFRQNTLLFPATTFQSRYGQFYMPYMHFEEKPGWYIQFCWVDFSIFTQSYRVVNLWQG